MCIFASSVQEVKNTKICVWKTEDYRQITVYQNEVLPFWDEKNKTNAMILPYPTNHIEKSVRLIDFSNYPDFFKDLKAVFPEKEKKIQTLGSFSLDETKSIRPLEVFRVGGYLCSVAVSLEELSRLDEKMLKIDKSTMRILERYYLKKFGFLICRFDQENSNTIPFHPIAFDHPSLTRDDLFVPTRHHHHDNTIREPPSNREENPKNGNIDNRRKSQAYRFFQDYDYRIQVRPTNQEEWDHEIYCFNGDFVSGFNGDPDIEFLRLNKFNPTEDTETTDRLISIVVRKLASIQTTSPSAHIHSKYPNPTQLIIRGTTCPNDDLIFRILQK